MADPLTVLHSRLTLGGDLMSGNLVMEHMTTHLAPIDEGRPVRQGEGCALLRNLRHSHARMRGADSEGVMVKSRPAGPPRMGAA